MNTVEPLTSDRMVSFCSFAFSGIWLVWKVKPEKLEPHSRGHSTADFAILATRAFGSSKFSMPSDKRSCWAWAEMELALFSRLGIRGGSWQWKEIQSWVKLATTWVY